MHLQTNVVRDQGAVLVKASNAGCEADIVVELFQLVLWWRYPLDQVLDAVRFPPSATRCC